MGLDQYLHATQYTSKYNKPEINKKLWKLFDKEIKPIDIDSAEVSFEIGYWRKANQIHKWFVDNCQEGKDECQSSEVSREQLEILLKICEEVIGYKDKDDKSEVENILPHQKGFFFGGYEYDEYYFMDIENTIEIIKKCLEMPTCWDFKYRASW